MAKTIQIDGKKLSEIVKAKKINMSQASRDVGMAGSYLSNCISYNYIAKAPAMLFEAKYGIMLDDYKYVEPEKPTVEATMAEVDSVYTPVAALDMNELQQAIALACQQTKAPEINYDRIREAVRDGVLDALYMANSDKPTRDIICRIVADGTKGGMLGAWRTKSEQIGKR